MKYVGPELTKPMSMLKFIQKLPLLFSAYSGIHATDLLDQIGSNSATRTYDTRSSGRKERTTAQTICQGMQGPNFQRIFRRNKASLKRPSGSCNSHRTPRLCQCTKFSKRLKKILSWRSSSLKSERVIYLRTPTWSRFVRFFRTSQCQTKGSREAALESSQECTPGRTSRNDGPEKAHAESLLVSSHGCKDRRVRCLVSALYDVHQQEDARTVATSFCIQRGMGRCQCGFVWAHARQKACAHSHWQIQSLSSCESDTLNIRYGSHWGSRKYTATIWIS